MKKLALLILYFLSVSAVMAVDLGTGVEFFPASRNMGLGTKTAPERLVVNGNVAIRETNTNPGATTNHGKLFINSNDKEFYFKSSDNNTIRITNNGTVVGDNLGNHLASSVLNMVNNDITNISSISLSDGSSANPSIKFSNDTNTGLYRVNNDTIGFSTGANERMRIDASGRVGLGETNPQTNLHLSASNSSITPMTEIEQLSTGDSALQFSISGDSYSVGIDNSDNDKFKISYSSNTGNSVLGTNDRFKIDSDGSVEIGSGSINQANETGDLYVQADLEVDGVIYGDGSGITNIVTSSLRAPDGSPNPALQVDNDGRIGIGTNAPYEAFLHVKNSTATRILAQHSDESYWSEFATAGVDASNNALRKWGFGSTGDTRSAALGGPNKFYIYQYTNKNDAFVNGYRMVIDDNGNVGIGTITPTQKLEVTGNIKATRFIGNGSGLSNISPSNITNFSIDGLSDGKADSTSVFLGNGSGDTDDGNNNNIGLGINSLKSITSGSKNIALGTSSLKNLVSSSGNLAVGYRSLNGLSLGSNNLSIGNNNFVSLKKGKSNLAIGNDLGASSCYSGNSIYIGNSISNSITCPGTKYDVNNDDLIDKNDAMAIINCLNSSCGNMIYDTNEDGFISPIDALVVINYLNSGPNHNIVIGNNIDVTQNDGNGVLSIANLIYGKNIYTTGSNVSQGNIGIGKSNPLAKLDVNGSIQAKGPLNIEGRLVLGDGTQGTGKILSSVDDSGFTSWIDPDELYAGQWKLVHSENFNVNGEIQNWRIGNVTSGLGYQCGTEKILGGYNISGKDKSLEKSFNLSNIPHNEVKITYDLYTIDSWDEVETASLEVNGKRYKSTPQWHVDRDRKHLCGNTSDTTSQLWFDGLSQESVESVDSSGQLNLKFNAHLDEILANESFGIDNLKIYVRTVDASTKLPETPYVPPPARYYQANLKNCSTYCASIGKTNVADSNGFYCASGEAKSQKAIQEKNSGNFAFTYGCWSDTNCTLGATTGSAQSDGNYCYRAGQTKDADPTDKTVACYCQ